MKKYAVLSHTADLRIKSWGENKEKLFENAMLGMASFLKPRPKTNGSLMQKIITISSPDLISLLVDFLSEVLTQSQIEKVVFTKINFIKFDENELEAKILGVKVDSFEKDIKAATYHDAEIKKENGLLTVTITYDI